jgi:hypothetical protein
MAATTPEVIAATQSQPAAETPETGTPQVVSGSKYEQEKCRFSFENRHFVNFTKLIAKNYTETSSLSAPAGTVCSNSPPSSALRGRSESFTR